MATYIVVNGKSTALTDINIGGTDVPAGTSLRGVVLTGAEVETLMAAQAAEPVALMAGSASDEEIRLASKILRLGKNPGTATT